MLPPFGFTSDWMMQNDNFVTRTSVLSSSIGAEQLEQTSQRNLQCGTSARRQVSSFTFEI